MRGLRIFGMIVFTVLVGLSAHRIQRLYHAGTLFETYNSARKANITLLVFSVLGLGVLGYLEISKSRRQERRRGYAPVRRDKAPAADGLGATSIYSRPESPDKWQGLRTRTSRSRHRESPRFENIWLGLLRILSVSLSVFYALLLVAWLAGWIPVVGNLPVLYGMAGFVFVLSLAAMVGVMRKKGWGLNVGYAIGIIHLLIFPAGTVVGLILMVSLVGAAPSFAVASREQRRTARNKRRKELHAT